jgi:hypothetical protein
MHSTLNPNRSDPHDVFVNAPDVVPAAHADDAHYQYPDDAMRPSGPQVYMESDLSDVPPIPPVDTTFRAADVNNVTARLGRPSMSTRAVRGIIGFLLAVCIGVAGALWQSHGDVATAMIAKWMPQLVPTSSPPPESPAVAEQPSPSVVQASKETTAPSQPAAMSQTTPESVAPAAAAASSDPAQLQAMAQDLASARQEIEQLKASVAQLKASQDQMSRDVAKVSASEVRTSEPTPRPRVMGAPPRPLAVPSPRPVAAPLRRPPPPLRPSQAAAAPIYPQAAAPPPPVVRQVEPQPLPAQAEAQPQLSSVPRPPASVPQ